MSQCSNCKAYLPPNFIKFLDDGGKKCIFCERQNDTIYYHDELGIEKKTTKKETIAEYKEFIDKIRANPAIDAVIEVTRKKEEDEELIKI
jgi:hypothetical protein